MSLLNAVIEEANKVSMEDIKTSRSELMAKIIDFSERLQVFSWGLQNYFLDVYLTSDTTRSLEQMNYMKRKYRASVDYEELQEEIRAFKKKFGPNMDVVNIALNGLTSAVDFFEDMCTLVDGIQTLGEANQEFNSYKYMDAVVRLKQLQQNLLALEFEGDMKTALENLLNQTEIQLSLSLANISLEWSRMFTWSFRKCVDTLTYSISVQQNDPILLQKILKALFVTEKLNAELHGFSDFFINKLILKLTTHNCNIYTEDHVGALIFNIKIDLNDKDRPTISTIFNNITAIFDFLESTLGSKLDAPKKFMAIFGDSNRDIFFSKIIDQCIKPHLPCCEKTYREYKQIAVELDTFNKFLVELKYVDMDESPLIPYIRYTDDTLFKRKCEKLLTDVREMMKHHIVNGFESVGTVSNHKVPESSILDVSNKEIFYDLNDPAFFPKCKISANVKKIAALMSRYLEESTAFPQDYCDQLALCIRDTAIMYQTLVPERFKENLQQNALDIALFFNNCNYLAHTLVGPPWKMTLPRAQADNLNAVVMEQIYDLRVVGMEKMSAYLEKTKEVVAHKIESISLPWTPAAFDAFDRAVNDVVIHFHRLKDYWIEILPKRMYEHSMCSLIETLTETMVKHLLTDSTEISGDVAYLLSMRFQYTINAIYRLFMEEIILDTKVTSWVRFMQVPKLLKAHLLELSSLWKENADLTQNFTCEEVRQIIKMRFPDNKYRLNVLMDIQ